MIISVTVCSCHDVMLPRSRLAKLQHRDCQAELQENGGVQVIVMSLRVTFTVTVAAPRAAATPPLRLVP
jgi:hypothetical protein